MTQFNANKRRSSWTNLLIQDKYNNTTTANTTLATNSPDSSKNGSDYSLPQKVIKFII